MMKTLNTSAEPTAGRKRTRHVEVALLLLLVPLAGYLWIAPILSERALARAPLNELVTLSQQHPDRPRTFYYLGVRYRQAGNLQQAEAAFSQAAKLGAEDEATWLAWSDTARDLNHDEDAFKILTLFLKDHPHSAPAHYALALHYQQNQAHKRAWEECIEATKCDSQNINAWRLAGEEALLWGRADAAATALHRAVALRPGDWRAQMDLGNVQVEQKQNALALASYHEAVRLSPKEPLAQFCLGRALLTGAQTPAEIEAAQQALEQAISLQPDLAPAYLLLGESYIRQTRWSEAQQALLEATRLAPSDPDTAFALSGVYRHLGNATAAAREAEQHRVLKEFGQQKFALISRIQEAPDDINARLKVARLCAAHGELRDARYFYRSVLTRVPDSPVAQQELAAFAERDSGEAAVPAPLVSTAVSTPISASMLLAEADALFKRNDLEGAKRSYLAVIARDRNAAPAYEGVGLILNAQGKSEDAYMFVEHAAKLDPSLSGAQFVLSQRYREIGFSEEAARRMAQVVQAVPDNPQYWYELGKDYGNTESEKAEGAYQHAVRLSPQNSAYLLDLAECEVENGHVTDAEQNYRRALSLSPQSADALSRLGGFLLTGHPTTASKQEAEQLLRRSLALQPHNDFALFSLGQLELERNHPQKAVAYLEPVVHAGPDIADAWYALSRAYERLGDHKKGAAALANSRSLRQDYQDHLHTEELLRQHTDNMALHRKMARLCIKKGEMARAILEYQLCLEVDAKDSAARKELEQLIAFLKTQRRMPPMNIFNIMVSEMAHRPD